MRFAAAVFFIVLLVACGKDATPQRATANGEPDERLPAPEGARGGVTGMPDEPGPGQIGPPPLSGLPPEIAVDEFGNPLLIPPDATPADGGVTVPGEGEPAVAVPDEPTPEDAVAVVRGYYAAINGGDFARAYVLWSDGGRASGQSPQQFADGFASTTGVAAEIMAPGRVDAATGSRYIEVPVALTATQRDGSQRRYVGAYVLRHAVVDGATPEQRAWRITSADIREVRP
jgi:hypothetical protein